MTDSIILTHSRLWQFAGLRGAALLAMLLILACPTGCDRPDGNASSAASPTISESDIQTALAAVQEHVQADRLEEAAVILDTLAEKAPDHAEVRQARGDIMFRLAERSAKGSDPAVVADLKKRAAQEYQLAAEADPDNAALWHAAGAMHSSAGNQDLALTAFERAAELDPTQAQYPLFAAQIRIARQEFDRAIAHLEAALAIDEDLPHAWASLAVIELERANLEQALAHIEKARELAPTDLGLRAQHARILRRSGSARQSLDMLAPLDETARFTGAVAEELALAYIEIDDLEAAAKAWDNAVARDLSLLKKGTVPLALARAYYEFGDRRTSLQWIRRARQAELTSAQTGTLQNLEIAVRAGG